MPRCKAKAKGTGLQCQRDAMIGYEVCCMHGAKGGRPAKTYRYVKNVERDETLKRNYEEILDDPTADDFDITPEIALLRARLGTAIEKGTVDLKVVNDIHRDLLKAVQKNHELQIKRQGLVQRRDAEMILREAVKIMVPYIPHHLRGKCFEELAAVLTGGKAGQAAQMSPARVIHGQLTEGEVVDVESH